MVLGITGISGSGKHTAADFLKQKGWIVLDADKIAHYLYRPYTSVWKAIVGHFGEGILSANDKIDRQKLGKIVFNASDPKKSAKELQALNEMAHPAVKAHIKNEIYYIHGKKNVAVVAALWGELGLPEYCEKMLLVTADKETAFKRIQKRDSADRNEFESRIKNQKTPPKPDYELRNDGEFKELYQALNDIVLKV
jgi:dephospho-CoA kinase